VSDISETISEKRRRGRPPRYRPETMTLVGSFCPWVQTVRGRQNKYYESLALQVLREEPGLEWLRDRDAMRQGKLHAYRPTLLQELGRIEDAETIKAVARRLCERKPTTRDAVATIRHFRTGQQPAGNPDDLTDRLMTLIDAYLGSHAGVDQAMILEALTRTARAVESSLGDDAG
jgi:hypothetical protein